MTSGMGTRADHPALEGSHAVSERDVSDLATRLGEGATGSDLAERLRVHRTTVSGHLHFLGVKMRRSAWISTRSM
jgi:hypothetical protein